MRSDDPGKKELPVAPPEAASGFRRKVKNLIRRETEPTSNSQGPFKSSKLPEGDNAPVPVATAQPASKVPSAPPVPRSAGSCYARRRPFWKAETRRELPARRVSELKPLPCNARPARGRSPPASTRCLSKESQPKAEEANKPEESTSPLAAKQRQALAMRKLHKTAEIYNAPVTVGHTFRRKLPQTLNHNGRPRGTSLPPVLQQETPAGPEPSRQSTASQEKAPLLASLPQADPPWPAPESEVAKAVEHERETTSTWAGGTVRHGDDANLAALFRQGWERTQQQNAQAAASTASTATASTEPSAPPAPIGKLPISASSTVRHAEGIPLSALFRQGWEQAQQEAAKNGKILPGASSGAAPKQPASSEFSLPGAPAWLRARAQGRRHRSPTPQKEEPPRRLSSSPPLVPMGRLFSAIQSGSQAMTLTCLEGVNSLLREAAGCVATTAWAWDLTPEDCRPENIAPLMGSNWQKNQQNLCSEAQEVSDEAKESDQESMVEVIYDPDWNVYYDPETHEYYELIEEELQK
ncbi:unnamed protein product [Symbiodinium necroappetens]|uniref:Uncharacterized protein n=1 Tax=Symbiodinium necroappetens TaxID=1628268 RepID=A0A812TXA1_9DINO|nr:unnamed protein product [Symbiodinium necroappetens]